MTTHETVISARREFEGAKIQLKALAESKHLTEAHANELVVLYESWARYIRHAFKMSEEYAIKRNEYLASDPATIAAEEQAADNFFPPNANDFFNS